MKKAVYLALILLLYTNTSVFAASRVTDISDTYTRANEAPLASPYRAVGVAGFGQFDLVSNTIQPNGFGAASDYMSVHTTAVANNQWSQVTCTSFVNSSTYCGVIVRWQASGTASGYLCQIDDGSGSMYIYKWTAATQASLASTSYTGVSGDVVRLEAIATALTCYVNDVLKISTSDPDYTSGSVGMEAYPNTGAGDVLLDAFLAGHYSSGVRYHGPMILR